MVERIVRCDALQIIVRANAKARKRSPRLLPQPKPNSPRRRESAKKDAKKKKNEFEFFASSFAPSRSHLI